MVKAPARAPAQSIHAWLGVPPPSNPAFKSQTSSSSSQPQQKSLQKTSVQAEKIQPASRFIIPAVNAEDHPSSHDDDYFEDYIQSGLDGDGLGIDDPWDQDDNPAADSTAHNESAAQPKPLPLWLKDEVDEKLCFLKQTDSTGCPLLYAKHETFWLPMKCGWFKMNNSTRMYPSLLYNRRFFYWDPLFLVNIKCPQCRTHLTRHGGIFKRPRRCFDINGLFYMIGARYKCSQCMKSLNNDIQKTFMSWDARIRAELPYALSCEFPCVLTHRGAISQDTFALERALVTAGLGTKQISDVFQVVALQKYDLKQIQYLEMINYTRLASPWTNAPYPAFSSFDDVEDFAGFVPSSHWLQDLFDDFVEKHTVHINQFTSMLSAEICAIDHSHKITKHIIQVNGVAVFIGMLTVTNEKGEVRILALVATKSHSQFEIALKRMSESLRIYGHCQPRLFYTDDLKDKGFLERTLQSLLEGVQPIEKFSNLPLLTLPAKWTITTRSSAAQIQQVLGTIQEDAANANTTPLVVGLDVEWNVNMVPGHSTQGKPAVVAIAYQTQVYILPIAEFVNQGSLPFALKNFLLNPNILKVGRNIASDLKCLQHAANMDVSFSGFVDIAQVAKAQQVTKTAAIGLADLSAIVLKHHMDKDQAIRVSTQWEAKILSEEQKEYVALDAYAHLAIYVKLKEVPEVGELPESPLPGLLVSVYQEDGEKLIAYGQWSSANSSTKVQGINITKTRAAINITKVIVQGAILKLHGQSLESFGQPPFTVVCKRSQLKTASTKELEQANDSDCISISSQAAADYMPEQSNDNHTTDTDGAEQPAHIVMGSWLQPTEELDETEILKELKKTHINSQAQKHGDDVFEELSAKPYDVVVTRVLKDPWHAFDLIYISKSHALRKLFARAVRDAMFVVNKEDRALVEILLKAQGSSWDEKLKYNPKWLWRRVRRTIPSPDELYKLLSAVIKLYGPLEDSATGQPLFNATAWKSAKNLLKLVQQGYLSDPPGIPLYYKIGVDRDDLPIWRCCRGTNFTEGGVHHSIRDSFPSSSISARHAVNRMNIFMLRHNLLVGTPNRTGKKYSGHFDIWLYNQLQEVTERTRDLVPDSQAIRGWVNGTMYMPTKEVFGILPVPNDIRGKTAMQPYIPENTEKNKHSYLASKQGTRYAVMNIHTIEEKQTFAKLMWENPVFNRNNQDPDWHKAVEIWNSFHANGKTIFYKVNSLACHTITEVLIYYSLKSIS